MKQLLFKRTNQMSRVILFAMATMQIFYSCTSEKANEKNTFPKEGILFFKSDQTASPEYIQIKFKDNEIEGKIFREQENKKIIHNFSGLFTSDTMVQVHTAYEDAELLEDWTIHIENEKMWLQNSLGGRTKIFYSIITSDKMPDNSQYVNVETLVQDTTETSDNIDSSISLYMQKFCFESIPPSSKKTNLWETIELSMEKDKVRGKGAGNEAEGGPEWVYDFNGVLVNDTVLELNINYRVRGEKSFSTIETWTLSNDREHLRLNKIEPVQLRQQGSGRFYRIDCAEINKNIKERMENGDFE